MKIRYYMIKLVAAILFCGMVSVITTLAQEDTVLPQTQFPVANRMNISDQRLMVQFLTKAKEAFDKGDYSQGLVFTQRILHGSEDFFIDDAEGEFHTSLMHQALQLLADLPEAGRRVYELEYGVVAQQKLADAVAANSVAQLEQITRQYFHTKAGYAATYRLGSYYLDRSQPLTASLYFERLRKNSQALSDWEPMLSLKTALCWSRAGFLKKSVRTLLELKAGNSKGSITLGGQQIPLFNDADDAVDWLVNLVGTSTEFRHPVSKNWTMFRGDSGRNAVSSQAVPVWETSWKFDTIREPWADDPKPLEIIRAQFEKLKKSNEDGAGSFLTFPATHPLIINDIVVFRTFKNIKALSLSTGELIWETAVTDSKYEELQKTGNETPQNRGAIRETPFDTFIKQRAWQDLTVGTLSTDGQFVFSIEKQHTKNVINRNARFPVRGAFSTTESNKLTAYELDSGRFLWEIGGGRNGYELDFAGMYFLGPPLPYGDRLYCLVEESGEIRLLVLKPVEVKPGQWQVQLDWTQGIADSDPSPTYRGRRRLAGISPSLANGVLVCPTISGAIVAVDPVRRLLLWKYGYRKIVDQGRTNQRALIIARIGNRSGYDAADAESRWLDSVPTIAESHILLTPRDSNELHCVSLVDGALKWKKPRGQGLYLAAIHSGKAIIVERAQIQAFDLEDGTLAWKQPTPIPLPSGRGYRTGDLYGIPLRTGEIATVELNTGRVLARSQSPNGEIPGNLVVAGQTLVSQSSDTIIGFQSYDKLIERITSTLEKDATDAKMLAIRGEIRLHQGRENEGIADLRRSFDINPSSHTRRLLVDRLLEGVRTDFAKYRDSTDEIAKLVEDPRQRSTFLRLFAAGLQSIGERRAAFSAYLKLAGPDTGDPVMERINGIISVRSDRWVRARISDLYAEAKPDERRDLDLEIEAQLKIAENQDGPHALRKFLSYFEDHRVASKARKLLVERLDEKSDSLELEFQLQQLKASSHSDVAGFATANLAQLLINLDRPNEAVSLMDELSVEWRDIVCLKNKTGKELVDEWRSDKKRIENTIPSQTWLKGRIEATHTQRNAVIERSYPIELLGATSQYFQEWTLNLDQRRQFVIARDGTGLEQWKISTNASNSTLPNVYGNYAFFHGHLLVIVLGNHFMVFDTFSGEESPKMLWQRQLFDSPNDQGVARNVQVRQFVLPGGIRRFNVMDPRGRPMGRVGIVNNQLICFQVGTRLFAADPLTGKTLWIRENVARGSDIFGDDRSVFVSEPSSGQSLILRTADGETSPIRPLLPSANERLATDGRNILTWKMENGKRHLALNDAMTGDMIWQKIYSEPAVVSAFEQDEIAVLTNTGDFSIHRIKDGQEILKSKTKPQANLTNIVVFRSQQRYVLLTTVPVQNQNVFRVMGLGVNTPVINGMAYCFDRKTGLRLWERKIENQTVELSQPRNLPVLVFACRLWQRPGGGRVVSQNNYAILILDKRNGQIVYEKRGPQALSTFKLTANLKEQKINIGFYRALISLQFTEKPQLAPEARKDGKKSSPQKQQKDGPQKNTETE